MSELDTNIHSIVNIGQTKILSNIYSDLAEPGVKKVGKAIGTILDLGNTILLPIKLLNSKTKLIFEKNINDYKQKLESIDSEKICNVPNELGVPIIDKLTYVQEENLRKTFINLLTKASSTETINLAHPGFISLIERMAPDEARIIQFLNDKEFVPCISLKMDTEDGHSLKLFPHLTGLEKIIELDFPQNIDLYIENLSSLGILRPVEQYKQYFDYSSLEKEYAELINSENQKYLDYNKQIEAQSDIFKAQFPSLSKFTGKAVIKKGTIEITDFGRLFIKACSD